MKEHAQGFVVKVDRKCTAGEAPELFTEVLCREDGAPRDVVHGHLCQSHQASAGAHCQILTFVGLRGSRKLYFSQS